MKIIDTTLRKLKDIFRKTRQIYQAVKAAIREPEDIAIRYTIRQQLPLALSGMNKNKAASATKQLLALQRENPKLAKKFLREAYREKCTLIQASYRTLLIMRALKLPEPLWAADVDPAIIAAKKAAALETVKVSETMALAPSTVAKTAALVSAVGLPHEMATTNADNTTLPDPSPRKPSEAVTSVADGDKVASAKAVEAATHASAQALVAIQQRTVRRHLDMTQQPTKTPTEPQQQVTP